MNPFQKLKAQILAMLGLASVPVKDGKANFSAEQTEKIKKEFSALGEDFYTKLEAALNAEIANKEAVIELNFTKEQLDALENSLKAKNEEISKLTSTVNELSAKVAKLEKKPEDDYAPTSTVEKNGKKLVIFVPKASHKHVRLAKDMIAGLDGATITASGIDVTDLKSEFGTYLSQSNLRLEVLQKLMQKTFSMDFMTSKQAITEWRASQSEITSVVQQFVSKWTPLGSSTFSPITITNRRHKINVPITPADVLDSWIMYLYDEGMTPEQMPITTYIINNLIIPKVAEDRELRLIGKGVYEALGAVTEGNPGQATGKSMDGFCTLLKNEKSSGISNMNFIDLGTITDANIVTKMQDFVDGIDEVYKNIPMNVFCSRDRYIQYKRAYQTLYPTTKNVDKSEDYIDFSLNRLQPLPSMTGEDLFFATPKENFIRLRNINDGAQKIFLQTLNYDVKVFAEWWEGVGFAIAQAVFAYVPDEASGSGSGS